MNNINIAFLSTFLVFLLTSIILLIVEKTDKELDEETKMNLYASYFVFFIATAVILVIWGIIVGTGAYVEDITDV